jgi:hypothetical protein
MEQFLSVDPDVGITGQPYSYAKDDAINGIDPLGLGFCLLGHNPNGGCRGASETKAVLHSAQGLVTTEAHYVIDGATDIPYLIYWGSFEGAAKLDKLGCSLGEVTCIGAHILALPFVPGEVVGIGIDAAGDWLKKSVLGLDYPCGTNDEGIPNQYFFGNQAGPVLRHLFGWDWRVEFPGIRPNGSFDFQW